MEPESRSLNWKTCFKKILDSLPSEEQNDAPYLVNSIKSEKQNDIGQNVLNPKNDSISTSDLLNNPEILKKDQKNSNASIAVESVDCQISEAPDGKLNDAENPVEESVESIIAAHAEELARSFKALKVKEKKRICNMTENTRNAPDWNIAFKKILDPKSFPESSLKVQEDPKYVPLKTQEEFSVENYYLSHPELCDSREINPWTFHRLCKKDERLENTREFPAESSSENCDKEGHYSEEEKKILEIFKQARTFKHAPKPHLNIFDGAGVDCFKDNAIKFSCKHRLSNTSKKPKNVPPPGGWVCIKPVTIEEARNRPPNIISSECWDWDEEDW